MCHSTSCALRKWNKHQWYSLKMDNTSYAAPPIPPWMTKTFFLLKCHTKKKLIYSTYPLNKTWIENWKCTCFSLLWLFFSFLFSVREAKPVSSFVESSRFYTAINDKFIIIIHSPHQKNAREISSKNSVNKSSIPVQCRFLVDE